MDIQGKRLRLLYPDIHGLERGKYLFGELAAEGVAAFCIGVYPLTHDKEILVGPPDAVRRRAARRRGDARPRLAPRRLGGRTRSSGSPTSSSHGEPAPWDTRHVLRQAVEPGDRWAWSRRSRSSSSSTCWSRRRGGWVPVVAAVAPRLRHRHVGRPDGTCRRMVNTALACGFPVESWCSEYDNAAYEVNIRYDDAIPAADEAFLFKLLVREICARHGKLATFLGRPLGDRGGSGLHVNFSFRRKDGSNAFHDPNDPEGLSELARRCVAGLLAHHEGMAAILAPHVNAYKRLQPDMLNGYWANWGHDDRSVGGARPAGARQGHAPRAADVRRGGEPVPRRGRHPARGPTRRGARAGAPAAAARRRGAEHGGPDPAEPRRGAGRAGRRTTSWSRPSVGAGGGVHHPEAGGVGAIPGRGRRPGDHRGHPWEIDYYLPFH